MIDIDYLISNIYENITTYFGGILNSSLYTSLLIILIIFLIMVIMIPIKRQPGLKKIVKPFLYLFVVIFIILYLHDMNILKGTVKSAMETESEHVIGGLEQFRKRDSNIYNVLNSSSNDNIVSSKEDDKLSSDLENFIE